MSSLGKGERITYNYMTETIPGKETHTLAKKLLEDNGELDKFQQYVKEHSSEK